MNQQFVGRVVLEPFAAGSKSERIAVKLVTPAGQFVLRRPSGNPYSDSVLEKLAGKTIRCEGRLSGSRLILSSWEVVEEKGRA